MMVETYHVLEIMTRDIGYKLHSWKKMLLLRKDSQNPLKAWTRLNPLGVDELHH